MQGRSFALLKHSWFAPGLGPTMRRSLLRRRSQTRSASGIAAIRWGLSVLSSIRGGKLDENRRHAALRILTRCAPRSVEQGPFWGMRPRRCAQERDIAGALASRSRAASPQAGLLLRHTGAHLALVRALPDVDFAGFPIDRGMPRYSVSDSHI